MSELQQQWILLLHGLGGDRNTMLPVGRRIVRRVPTARYETMQGDHADHRDGRLQWGWFAAPSDEDRYTDGMPRAMPASLERSLGRVHRSIDAAISRGLPSESIYVVGHSQGAALAIAAGMTYRRTLGGVGSIAGYVPLPDAEPVAEVQTPFLLLHADEDPVVTARWADYAAALLERRGFSCALRRESTPAAPHAIHRWQMMAIADWIAGHQAEGK